MTWRPWLVTVLVEALAVTVLVQSLGSWWSLFAAAAHGAAALLAIRFGGARREARFFAFAVVLALPLVGILGLGAARWGRSWAKPPERESISASLAELQGPDQHPQSLEQVFEWIQAQLSVRPLIDVIRSSDPATKREAVQTLSQRHDGEAVDLLREALQAPDPSVQIAASTALQKVEERLTERISRLREATLFNPSIADDWAALGDACLAYQQSRLLEPVLERLWLDQAEDAYGRALALEPERFGHKVGLARVLLVEGRLEEAEQLAREARVAAPAADVDLLLSEILFARGDWGELRSVCRAATAAGQPHALMEWWAEKVTDEVGGGEAR
jgi:tetratricopeptide (TPR) repeat protein